MIDTEIQIKLSVVKAMILEVRNRRILRGKDDKILAGWNGLMRAGLIQTYYATGENRMLDLVLANLEFIREKMLIDGILHRSYKNGQAYTPAFLEDYAAVIKANLMAFEATGD